MGLPVHAHHAAALPGHPRAERAGARARPWLGRDATGGHAHGCQEARALQGTAACTGGDARGHGREGAGAARHCRCGEGMVKGLWLTLKAYLDVVDM